VNCGLPLFRVYLACSKSVVDGDERRHTLRVAALTKNGWIQQREHRIAEKGLKA
jgi:hypothetical protein